jgi:choline monooxygenase
MSGPPPAERPGELVVDAEITRARMPPPALYRDGRWFEALRERVLARSWHLVAHESELPDPASCRPLTLLPGLLDEPLLLARGAGGDLALLSNVCTHRGALLCEAETEGETLRCRYHGRRFALDGRALSSPGFETLVEEDDLGPVPLASWRGFLFASLDPVVSLDELLAGLDERLGWLPVESARLRPDLSRHYDVPAHWALYVDNYLEGLHVPFVHPSLAPSLDLPAYRGELLAWANLQIAEAADNAPALQPPPSSPDHGRRVAGYYAWLFPCTMLNAYPWGLSINVVQPLAPDRTRVIFQSWVWDDDRLGGGASADLHGVELEDEAVVAGVQRGMASRSHRGGRYAPEHEVCVHHFHRLLADRLGADR